MDNIINKCIKSYKCGIKYLDNDIDKSLIYFKQSLKIIENLKKNNILLTYENKNNIDNIEIECYKYIPINLFDIIERGDINILTKLDKINFKSYNENGIQPIHYAIDYGDISFIKFALNSNCTIDETTLSGNTLLEYACLKKDPNIISFLINNGANMKKHLEFRKGNKYINNYNSIDIVLLLKIIMDIESNNSNNDYLKWIYKYIDSNIILDIKYNNNNIIFNNFIIQFNYYLDILVDEYRESYLNIIKEELEYNLQNNSNCPNNKIELILYYLVPFINYNFNLNLQWLNKYFN